MEALFNNVKSGWGNAGTEVYGDDDTAVIPDLRGMFLRGTGSHGSLTMADGNAFAGAAIGASENDQLQQFKMDLSNGTDKMGYGTNGAADTTRRVLFARGAGVTDLYAEDFAADGAGTPRTGDETRPVSYGINYIIKI
jgi:hypothetical protein